MRCSPANKYKYQMRKSIIRKQKCKRELLNKNEGRKRECINYKYCTFQVAYYYVLRKKTLREEKSSDELLGRMGIVSVVDVVRKARLHWYGHEERKDVEDWLSEAGGSGVQE